VAAPSDIFTIARVARMLGEDEALLEDIALMSMDPEDGRLTIIDLDDEVSTTAFTPFGVENLKELLANLNRNCLRHCRYDDA
jgi:hypothetical protein